MSPDRWTALLGNPDAVSGATRSDGRRGNEGRTKDDAPGAAPANDVVGSPGFGDRSAWKGVLRTSAVGDSDKFA